MMGLLMTCVCLAGFAEGKNGESPILDNWKSYREKRLVSEMNLLNREYSSLKRILIKEKSDPHFSWGCARACELAMQLGRWTEALDYAETLIAAESEPGLTSRATRWRARAMLRSERSTEQAIDAYEQLAKQSPADAASPLLELHDFLVAQGRLEPIEGVLSLLQSIRPELAPYVEEIRAQARRIGGSAPGLDGKLLDGTDLSSDSLRGKVTLVHFWSLENRESLEALHRFSDLVASHEKKGALVGINLDGNESLGLVRTYLDATGVIGIHRQAEGGFASELAFDFQVDSLPSHWVLDPEGEVAGINLNLEATTQLFERLLAKNKK